MICAGYLLFVVSFYGEYEQTAKADGRYLLVNIVKEKGKNLMKHIYLNLKRFDVPVEFGGVNRLAPVADWASCIVKIQEKLKTYDPTEVEFGMYFPEVHLRMQWLQNRRKPVQIGCQSVFRADTAVGGNFAHLLQIDRLQLWLLRDVRLLLSDIAKKEMTKQEFSQKQVLQIQML